MRDRGKEVERLYGYHIAVCEDDPFIRDRICQVCEETGVCKGDCGKRNYFRISQGGREKSLPYIF